MKLKLLDKLDLFTSRTKVLFDRKQFISSKLSFLVSLIFYYFIFQISYYQLKRRIDREDFKYFYNEIPFVTKEPVKFDKKFNTIAI